MNNFLLGIITRKVNSFLCVFVYLLQIFLCYMQKKIPPDVTRGENVINLLPKLPLGLVSVKQMMGLLTKRLAQVFFIALDY